MLKIIFYGAFFVLILVFYVPEINLLIDYEYYEEEVMPPPNNEYALEGQSVFAKHYLITDSFLANDRNDLISAFFTTINSGANGFTFYCAEDYEECFEEVKELTKDAEFLTYFNNFVHPFNNYKTIGVTFDSRGKVRINLTRLYSDEEINILNQKVKQIWDETISDNMSKRQKIKEIHNNILNNSIYDQEKAKAIDEGRTIEGSTSHKAIGPLVDGLAICSGYSDAMSLFLYKMDVTNYRISNEKHVWNFLKLDDEWLHLDLTWNQPMTDNQISLIIETYFLISSQRLKELDSDAHYFDENMFIEAQ